MTGSPFHGVFTPLVTPLNPDEGIDHESLRRLVDFQIEHGIHGLWAMGTTGEFAAFDEDERAAATQTVIDAAQGRVPIIANVSDVSTRLVIRHAQHARDAGAGAIAVTPPYYYPNSQPELLDHYRRVHAAIDLPLYIYNIPQTVRTHVSLLTAQTLISEGVVSGIKDSQNNFEWFRSLTQWAAEAAPEFRAFAGTRHLIDAAVLAGAIGVIPSAANVYPDLCVSTYEAAAAGDYVAAQHTQSKIVALENALVVGDASANGAAMGALKQALVDSGVIAHAALTAPLRSR